MREVIKVQILLGIFSLLLLFYEIFVTVPELLDVIGILKEGAFKLILHTVLRLGLYASLSTWSLSSVLTVHEET